MLDFPANPTQGQVYENWSWDGTKWTPISTGGGATFSISDTPPASPQGNTLWWDSVGGQLYVWYNDGNTTQWVPTTNLLGGLGEAPADGEIYARNGQAGSWVAALPAAGAGRNLLHNSLFNVQQRGQGPWTANGAYTADRWMMFVASDSASVSIQPWGAADWPAIGDESAEWNLQNVFTGSATAGACNLVSERIEDVRRTANKIIIASFWAKATAGTPKLGIGYTQSFGSGGSASVSGNLGTTPTLTATATRYWVSGTIPSSAAKLIGAGHYCSLDIWFSAQSNAAAGGIGVQSGTVQLWGMQLEIAAPGQTQPTPLQKIDPREDLANCQRFFSTLAAFFASGTTASGLTVGVSGTFPTSMRAAPTLTLSANNNSGVIGSPSFGGFGGANGQQFFAATAITTGQGTFVMNMTATASADL